MNELVTADRGLPVGATKSGTLNASDLWQFDEAALEACVEKAAAMPDAEVSRLGGNARAWYEANQAGFTERLRAALYVLL
jgi:hypothetical protein